jgi:hypothetical protein
MNAAKRFILQMAILDGLPFFVSVHFLSATFLATHIPA